MDTLVPVIGHELLDGVPLLRTHVVSLVRTMGLKPLLLKASNEPTIFNPDPLKVRIKATIFIGNGDPSEVQQHWLKLITSNYPDAHEIATMPETVTLTLDRVAPRLSLYQGPRVSPAVRDAIDFVYQRIHDPSLNIGSICQNN